MKTFHEWLVRRQAMQSEGLWLGDDKLAVPGMSNVNPLDQPKAKEKPKPAVKPVKTLKAKPAAKALSECPASRTRRRRREANSHAIALNSQ
jgi:hypothetical protein